MSLKESISERYSQGINNHLAANALRGESARKGKQGLMV